MHNAREWRRRTDRAIPCQRSIPGQVRPQESVLRERRRQLLNRVPEPMIFDRLTEQGAEVVSVRWKRHVESTHPRIHTSEMQMTEIPQHQGAQTHFETNRVMDELRRARSQARDQAAQFCGLVI